MERKILAFFFIIMIALILTACDEEVSSEEIIYDPNIQITVKDISPPVILGPSNIDVDIGENFDCWSFMKIQDNLDPKPEVEVTGEVNINVADVYELVIKTKDNNGNASSRSITVTVHDKIIDNNSTYPFNGSSNGSSQNNPGNPQSDPGNKPNLQSKSYLFANGYDMNTAPAACEQDLLRSGSGGRCIPIKDANGIFLGVSLEY